MSRLPWSRNLLRPLLTCGCLALAACASMPGTSEGGATVSLFDGKTLAGWEGTPNIWRVEDGALTGGSLTETVPHNEFLATRKSYRDFDLTLKIKLSGTEGFINSGIQIRSRRVPGTASVSGYQVDYGRTWYGKLYDEARRNKIIAESADQEAVFAAVNEGGWNEYRILAQGPRIRTWVNGVPALDFTEQDPSIPLEGGIIAIQLHGGGKALIQAKDITIRELGSREPVTGS